MKEYTIDINNITWEINSDDEVDLTDLPIDIEGVTVISEHDVTEKWTEDGSKSGWECFMDELREKIEWLYGAWMDDADDIIITNETIL